MASKRSAKKTDDDKQESQDDNQKAKQTAGKSSDGSTDLGAATAEAAGQVQDTATRLADQVQQLATTRLSDQKEKLTGTLETVTLVIQQVGEQVRQQDHEGTAQYIDMAGERVEQFTSTLREQEVSQIVTETKQFAQQRPGLFLGGAVALGAVVTRFFQSSARKEADSSEASDSSDTSEQSTEQREDSPEKKSSEKQTDQAEDSQGLEPSLELTDYGKDPMLGLEEPVPPVSYEAPSPEER